MATADATGESQIHGTAPGEKGLRGGSLGLVSSVVMGMASTAPAYSLASALGFVVATVALQSPVIMLLAFVPMYMIAVAYKELNEAEPDCGTTFTWAARAFGASWGWMGGWGIFAADVIVMANLAQIAGSYGYLLVGADSLATSNLWVTVAGITWIVVMTYISWIGIEISAKLQYLLLGIEVVILGVLAGTALVKVYSGNGVAESHRISLSWFNPFDISSPGVFAAGILAAVFIYWGWDTAVACNEETSDAAHTPGRAAVISTVLLLMTYVIVTLGAQAWAGSGTHGIGLGNPANSDDVLSVLGTSIFGTGIAGSTLVKLLLFMVMTSSMASTLTTILPTARTTLSMAAFKAAPQIFARIHPKYLTPTWSTWGMGAASVVFYVILTSVSGNVLNDSIGSLGLMIAFYYGLTGFACFWFYRNVPLTWRQAMSKRVIPLLGGILLLVLFVYAASQYIDPNYGYTSVTLPGTSTAVGGVFALGIGVLLLGVVLMLIWRAIAPAYFRGETLPRKSYSELVLLQASGSVVPTFGLPDSKSQATVIAPDLSNLPPGMGPEDVESAKDLEAEQERELRDQGERPDDPKT
jgi:amino acid transporter